MAIQHRRGNYSDFDPSKMRSGEISTVQEGDPNTVSGESVYSCQRAGTVKRLAFVEDIEEEVFNLTDPISDAINLRVADNVNAAQQAAQNAATSAAEAANYVTMFTDPDVNGNIVISIGANEEISEEVPFEDIP